MLNHTSSNICLIVRLVETRHEHARKVPSTAWNQNGGSGLFRRAILIQRGTSGHSPSPCFSRCWDSAAASLAIVTNSRMCLGRVFGPEREVPSSTRTGSLSHSASDLRVLGWVRVGLCAVRVDQWGIRGEGSFEELRSGSKDPYWKNNLIWWVVRGIRSDPKDQMLS